MLVLFFTFIHANLVVCKEAKKGIDEFVHWSLLSISVNILFELKFVDYVLEVLWIGKGADPILMLVIDGVEKSINGHKY